MALRLVTFLGGLYFILEFLLPKTLLDYLGISLAHEAISNGFITVGAMALGLGIINLLTLHGSKVVLRRRGAFYSGVLIFAFFSMILLGGIDWYVESNSTNTSKRVILLRAFLNRIIQDEKLREEGKPLSEEAPPFAKRVELLTEGLEPIIPSNYLLELQRNPNQILNADFANLLILELNKKVEFFTKESRDEYEKSFAYQANRFLIDGLFTSLGASMFSLLAVYIAAAAYRAFRITSIESGVMMLTAVVVILGQTFLGLSIWEDFPRVRLWLMQIPSSAAFRAIRIGGAIAGLVLAFRIWLSIEAHSFGQRGNRVT
jgi:hypothetical protein